MSVTQASLLGDTIGNKSSGTIPVGGIIMWSGSIANIPTGWGLCNGSNGTPDLRDRFIVGAGGGYNPASTGGANSVTLDITQIPSHNHTITDPGHSHTVQYNNGAWNSGTSGNTCVAANQGSSARATTTQTTGITIANAGGGQAHENRPPYYALAFIMRVS